MKVILPTEYAKLTAKTRKLVRDKYIEIQKGLCWYCDRDLDKDPPIEITNKHITWRLFPKGFMNYPKHIQHDHSTGLTEGVVHAYCNAVLWEYFGR